MKRLAVLISIFVVVFLSLLPAFVSRAAQRAAPMTDEERANALINMMRRKPGDRKPVDKKQVDVKPLEDVEDANTTEAEAKKPTEIENAVKRLNAKSYRESREWARDATQNKIDLAKAVEEQITAELNFIREFAAEEEAVKTTDAIDAVLASRKDRFQKTLQQMEEQSKRSQTSNRTRRERRPGTSTRTRDRTPRSGSRSSSSRIPLPPGY